VNITIEMHSGFKIQDMSKESPKMDHSPWILSCLLKLLCIFIAPRVANLRTWGGHLSRTKANRRL